MSAEDFNEQEVTEHYTMLLRALRTERLAEMALLDLLWSRSTVNGVASESSYSCSDRWLSRLTMVVGAPFILGA